MNISGEALTTIFTAIVSAGGALILKSRIPFFRIGSPVPTVPVQKVGTPVTYEQHRALEKRVDEHQRTIEQLRTETGEQYRTLLEAGQNREIRIRDTISASARATHERIDAVVAQLRKI